MRWACLLVAAVACAPAPPEKLRTPPRHRPPPPLPVEESTRPPPELVPRPQIAGMNNAVLVPEPDFHDELRWPLTAMNHPAVEPKFPIAEQLAQPGIGWLQLCDRGIPNRHGADQELLSYLRGWCKAVAGDADAACGHLAPLMKAKSSRLANAVRNDIANILAQSNADDAERLIRVHSLHDVGMLDFLAANYVEVGTSADALAINRVAIDSDDYATHETMCLRWTRQIVLSGDRKNVLLRKVHALTRGTRPDRTCVHQWHKLNCWANENCQDFWTDKGVAVGVSRLTYAYRLWDSARDTMTSNTWWMIADGAMAANPERGFAEVATAAMENAVRMDTWVTGSCTEDTARWLAKYAPTLIGLQDAALTQRVEALKTKCPAPAAPTTATTTTTTAPPTLTAPPPPTTTTTKP